MAPPPTTPVVKIAKSLQAGSGGVLPVSTTGSKPKVTGSQGTSSRHPAPGLKVNIRRLPPGLTEEEFQAAVGDEWKVGKQKVDWYYYAPGKTSKDPSKASRPARAYLHLTDAYVKERPGEPLKELQTKLASTSFNDAKGTHTDPALFAPWPTVIAAPYSRIPSTKIRKDNRQGTIDQDPEFIDFLQELTNPIIKPIPIDAITEKESKPEEKIITPLVQYLREKKANKAKENSSGGKGSKHNRQESKDPKAAAAADKKSSKGTKDGTADKKASSKSDKATKEPIKVLSKPSTQAANAKSEKNATPAAASKQTASTSSATPVKSERRRERGSAAAAAKILQRDLGIGSGANSRRRRDANNTNSPSKPADQTTSTTDENANGQTNPSSTASAATAAVPSVTTSKESAKVESGAKSASAPSGQRNNATRNQAKSNAQPGKGTSAAQKSASKSNHPTVTPTATEAFLKHANPSQGITEDLLQATFAGFGVVTKVEIDKKKGFAYIDFAEPEALQSAIAASPVKIAQAAVVVLERKAPAGASNRGTRGDSRGGRGGGSQRGGHGRGRGRAAADSATGTPGATASVPSETAPSTAS